MLVLFHSSFLSLLFGFCNLLYYFFLWRRNFFFIYTWSCSVVLCQTKTLYKLGILLELIFSLKENFINVSELMTYDFYLHVEILIIYNGGAHTRYLINLLLYCGGHVKLMLLSEQHNLRPETDYVWWILMICYLFIMSFEAVRSTHQTHGIIKAIQDKCKVLDLIQLFFELIFH